MPLFPFQKKLPVWDINDLKPGDKIFIPTQTMVGWTAFRYYQFKELTVVRITPKKTKVYATDGASESEYLVTKTPFFKDSPELRQQHNVAVCASSCYRMFNAIDNKKHLLTTMPDDTISDLYDHLATVLEILEKCDKSS